MTDAAPTTGLRDILPTWATKAGTRTYDENVLGLDTTKRTHHDAFCSTPALEPEREGINPAVKGYTGGSR
jgi:hypothetical protein